MQEHTKLLRAIEQLQAKSEREMHNASVLADLAKVSMKEAGQTLQVMKDLLLVLQKDLDTNRAPKTVVNKVSALSEKKDGKQLEMDLELTRFESHNQD